MINHIDNVLTRLREEIELMDKPTYPIKVETIFEQSEVPVKVEDSELPAVFFGYGESKQNDGIRKPSNYKGETSIIHVYAVLTKTDDRTLIQICSDMQTAIRMIVVGSQSLGNDLSEKQTEERNIAQGYKIFTPSTKEVRLARTIPFRQRSRSQVSRRVMLDFSIEIDHIYPVI